MFRVVTERKFWTETRNDHARGFSYPVTQHRDISDPWQAMVHCVKHRRPIGFAEIRGHFSASKKCDARCTGAVGPSCDCQCRGQNHGGRHALISI